MFVSRLVEYEGWTDPTLERLMGQCKGRRLDLRARERQLDETVALVNRGLVSSDTETLTRFPDVQALNVALEQIDRAQTPLLDNRELQALRGARVAAAFDLAFGDVVDRAKSLEETRLRSVTITSWRPVTEFAIQLHGLFHQYLLEQGPTFAPLVTAAVRQVILRGEQAPTLRADLTAGLSLR